MLSLFQLTRCTHFSANKKKRFEPYKLVNKGLNVYVSIERNPSEFRGKSDYHIDEKLRDSLSYMMGRENIIQIRRSVLGGTKTVLLA